MTKRRRFTAEFQARVALEALRGDKPIRALPTSPQAPQQQKETTNRIPAA